jgi:hypothetical protein
MFFDRLRRAPRHRPRCAPGVPRYSRLRLDPLEDRLVPATFVVNTALDEATPGDRRLSLREAVSAANASPGPDAILLPAGVFKITLPGEDSTNAAGDFDITGDTLIRGAGAGATVGPRSSTLGNSTARST